MRAKSYTCGASQPSTDLVRATDDLLHGSFVPPTLRPHLITLFFRDLTFMLQHLCSKSARAHVSTVSTMQICQHSPIEADILFCVKSSVFCVQFKSFISIAIDRATTSLKILTERSVIMLQYEKKKRAHFTIDIDTDNGSRLRWRFVRHYVTSGQVRFTENNFARAALTPPPLNNFIKPLLTESTFHVAERAAQ